MLSQYVTKLMCVCPWFAVQDSCAHSYMHSLLQAECPLLAHFLPDIGLTSHAYVPSKRKSLLWGIRRPTVYIGSLRVPYCMLIIVDGVRVALK